MIQVKVEHSRELEKFFNSSVAEVRRNGHIILGRAINRAATAGRTRASVAIRRQYIVKAADIKRKIKIRRATSNQLSAQIRASGPVTPLIQFDVSPKMPDIMRVRARVKKESRQKPIDDGFVTRAENGFVNVFTRVGSSRYPIKSLFGPSIAQMMGRDENVEDIQNRVQEVLDDRLSHELEGLWGL